MADNILINGIAVTDADFNNTTPSATAGLALVEWQRSGTAPDLVSAQIPNSVPVVLDREMTDLSITNTTVETSIFSHSVPANAMGTNRSLHLVLLATLAAGTAATTITFRVKFGGTTIFSDLTGSFAIDVSAKAVYVDVWVGNQNATNDQTGGGLWITDQTAIYTLPTTGLAGDLANASTDGSPMIFANSALDTTAAQTFDVTIQFTTAGAANVFTRKMAVLTLV